MDQPLLLSGVQAVAAAEYDHQQQQGGQLGGEGLGRGDANLGSGAGHQHQVGGAHQRALGYVADGQGRAEAAGLGLLERGQGVGGLAGLGDGHHQGVLQYHRPAVAEFAGDLDPAGYAGQGFEPVAGDQTGVVAGAASQDLDLLDAVEQLTGTGAEHLVGDAIAADASLQGVGDRARLFVDLLEHVVAIFAALDRVAGQLALFDGALVGDVVAVGIVDDQRVVVQVGDVAVFEEDETLGDR